MSIGDKIVRARFRLSLAPFILFVSFGSLWYSTAILVVFGIPSVSVGTALATIAVGALFGAGLIVMFWMLAHEEVSRVVPVFQSYPIFVAIAAGFVLDERLSWMGWLAVVLTVGGAGLVSINLESATGFRFRAGFPLLILGAMLAAGSQLLLKGISSDVSFWDAFALRGFGLFLVLGLPQLRPSVIRELVNFLRRPERAAVFTLTEPVGAAVGSFLLVYAVAHGPVSLASAILGTRPLFVFILTVVLAWKARWILSESLGRRDLAAKFVSAGLVVTGLVLIGIR